MKTFLLWFLVMHDPLGAHYVVGLKRADCEATRDGLNASAGSHRGYSWTCEQRDPALVRVDRRTP